VLADAEAEAEAANKELQQAETTLLHAKAEVKSKRDEMKSKQFRVLEVYHILIVRRTGEEARQ